MQGIDELICPRCKYRTIWVFTGEMKANQKGNIFMEMIYYNRQQCGCGFVGEPVGHRAQAQHWSVIRWIEANDEAVRHLLVKLFKTKA